MVDRAGHRTEPIDLPLLYRIDNQERTGWVHHTSLKEDGIDFYFVTNDHFYNRNGLYQEDGKDYPDNLARMTFFCRAALELLTSKNFEADIVQCFEWPTGLIPAYLKTDSLYADLARQVRVLFCIQNIAYQGFFPRNQLPITGISWDHFNPEELEFYGDLNLLKAGLVYSDHITTVSESYARDIQTPEHGCGMESVVQAHRRKLTGIHSGLDYKNWDPANNSPLPVRYTREDLKGKAACKDHLQKEFELALRPQIPVFATVTDFGSAMEMGVVPEALEMMLLADEIQLMVLESSVNENSRIFQDLRQRFPHQVGIRRMGEPGIAQLTLAGADFLIIPGRSEPSGMNQLTSLRYGTPPILRKTGPLAGSIKSFRDDPAEAVGFVYHNVDEKDLLQAVRRGLSVYRDKTAWAAMQRRAMACDFSWDTTAEHYERLYTSLLEDLF
jgi:starch synthase